MEAREALQKQLLRIDQALEMLETAETTGGQTQLPGVDEIATRIPAEVISAGVPTVVAHVVKSSASGLTAKEVIELVVRVLPETKPDYVHSTLYRLKKKRVLSYTGTKGSGTYFSPETQGGALSWLASSWRQEREQTRG